MPELDKAKNALTELGWSEYESKTYSALVQLGRATASKIAKNSNVPPNRVYQILAKLSEKGIVHMTDARGSATQYEAVDPDTVLNRLREQFSTKIENALNALEELKERTMDKEFPITYTIYGKRELATYLQTALKKSQEEIFIVVDTLVEIRHRDLVEVLNTMAQSVQVRVLTTERGINDEYEKEVIQELVESIPIKYSTDPFSTIFTIIDDEVMIFSAYGFREEGSGDLDYYGVYTEDAKTAQLIKKSFDLAFEKAEFVQKPMSEDNQNTQK